MKLILVTLLTITFAGVYAQKKNCCKPPAFSFEDLPEATPKPGHGNCHLNIASQVDSVSYYADQGINMFFSFNYYESFMALNKAYQLDTNCVGCLLGCLMTLDASDQYSTELYADLYQKAYDMHGEDIKMSAFETDWLDLELIPSFYKRKDQAGFYDRGMTEMYQKYTDDPVVFALYVTYMDDGMTPFRTPEPNTVFIDSIISNNTFDYLLENSAVMHMAIHLYEDYKPSLTLKFSEHIVETAPNSGHIVHMPGHAYYYNGMYYDAELAFKRSFEIDSLFNAKNKYGKELNWNYIHNLDFLCQTLAEQGKVAEAELWSKKLQKATINWNMGIGGEMSPRLYKAPMMMNYRLKRWNSAAEAVQTSLENDELNPLDKFYLDGMKIFFDGMNAFEKDHDDTLQIFIKKLDKHLKKSKKIYKENDMRLGVRFTTQDVEQLKINRRLLKFLAEEKNQPITDPDNDQLNDIEYDLWTLQTSDPPKVPILAEEIFADILEKQGHYDEAAKALHKALELRPNSGIILLHLARMYYRSGNKIESQKYLDQFNEAWKNADKNLIEFEKARVLQINLDK